MASRAAAVAAMLMVGAALAPAALGPEGARAAGREWRPAVDAARAYVARRAGSVYFAVRTEGALYGYRPHRTARSYSVVKAMLMVAYLNHRSVRGRPLRDGDRALLTPMIRWSDNSTASLVRAFVGNGALAALARQAGMRRFQPMPAWGLSRISAADQARFFLSIDRLVARRHRRTALRLLGSIVGWQRWGIASARPQSWALYFKGGWGSGAGAVNHQIALLRRGRRRVAVGMLTTGNPSHGYGQATLEGVARRLLRGLRADSVPR